MSSKRFKEYQKYLESDHWKRLKKETFTRDGWKCIKCGRDENLQGHHRKYRAVLTQCTVLDIQTLCEPCHNEHHRQKAAARAKRRREKRELMKQFDPLVLLIGFHSAKDVNVNNTVRRFGH